MTFLDVMNAERAALLAEYTFQESFAGLNIPPYSAVPDLTIVERTPSALRSRYPVTFTELSGKRAGQAVIQSCDGLKYKFLWAHVDNNSYLDDYLAFARANYNIGPSERPRGLHVDHLFNRERARALKLTYIRMVLAPAGINTSHGAGIEKSRTNSGIGREGRERSIDTMILLKLLGISSPKKGKALTPEAKAQIARVAAMLGLPASEIEADIQDLMQVANFKPRG